MGAEWMTIVGGGMEMLGFGLIVFQLVRVQRQEFGTPVVIARARNWLRGRMAWLLKRRRDATIHAASARGTASGGGSITASVWRGMGPDVPNRLEVIEQNLSELKRNLDKLAARHEQTLGRLGQDVSATRTALEQHRVELEAQRKAELRSSIRYEASGVGFFLAGTVLSVWGSL